MGPAPVRSRRMDTLTHALTGALAGRVAAGRVLPRHAAWVTAAACAFPDVDFLFAPLDPYAFLELHRRYTHSLVLLPLWATLLAWLAVLLLRRYRVAVLLPYTALGIAVHIVGDLFNVWTLQPLWPLSGAGLSFPVLWVIDPLYTALVLGGLAASVYWRSRAGAVAGLGVVALYTVVQFPLNAYAAKLAAELPEVHGTASLYVEAQPLSPLHRRLVIDQEAGPHWAYLRLFSTRPSHPPPWLGGVGRLWSAYRPAGSLEWEQGVHPYAAGGFAAAAWQRDELVRYRDFARLPYVYAWRHEEHAECVWFADVRFTLPELPPSFRWGLCRDADGLWTRQRLGLW
jgi:inner membrane protein